MRTCRIAIAGLGQVGKRTAELLLARRERYAQLYDVDVRLVAAFGSSQGICDAGGLEIKQLSQLEPGKTGPAYMLSTEPDILIEAGPSDFRTGGPALAYLRAALGEGRNAIVISKGALVHDGPALRDLARLNGALLKISGATAAALPTIDLLHYSLLGCEVMRIEGILNATSNHLLEGMMRGASLDLAIAEAQAAGIAERDPYNDIAGWDTACKLLLLANFGLGARMSIDDISVSGIEGITQADIAAWHSAGVAPRLVGELVRDETGFSARVAVRSFPASHPFFLTSGSTKAIRITTDAMGELLAMGFKSGPLATAAAALKDLEHLLCARYGPAGSET